MADKAQRDKVIDERFVERMNQDFNPQSRPEHPISPELRVANAAEYIAFQLGQINRKLDKLLSK